MDEPVTTPAPSQSAEIPAKESTKFSAGGPKELIESILIAFILAFVFRAFVIEAFVIPTGSMAPTLMGAHTRYSCADCGYDFNVNFSWGTGDESDADTPSRAIVIDERGQRVQKIYSLFCPNCGYKVSKDDATSPPVHYGDRILVLKYLYLFQDPSRWDVVVFKAPTLDRGEAKYQTNYIKRLVGKPGESIMVLDGDVYLTDSQKADLSLSDFAVQTKTESAQDALWRVVYDNDFHPTGKSRADGTTWKQPWTPADKESGWTVETPGALTRAFQFKNETGAASIVFDPHVNPNSSPFTDWLAYNQVGREASAQGATSIPNTFSQRPYTGQYAVSDLRLCLTYSRQSGEGPLRLKMTKRDRQFIAEIFPDHVNLLMQPANGPAQTLYDKVPVKMGSQARVEFQNVDYCVTLKVDGKIVCQTTPQQYSPDMRKLLEDYETGRPSPKADVRIEAEKQTSELSHVSLWRDVFYTSERSLPWATPAQFPNRVVRLGADEFFVMGDNSPVSSDARFWRDPVNLPGEDLNVQSGRVPARFMLGKAFFVYWPAGFTPFGNLPALVPNFGQMRFIH